MEILTLNETKEWLRVDYDEDDVLIELLIENALHYLSDAVDDFENKLSVDKTEKFKNKARLVMLTLITNWYDTRDYIEVDTRINVSEKTRHTIHSILQQMKHGDYGE